MPHLGMNQAVHGSPVDQATATYPGADGQIDEGIQSLGRPNDLLKNDLTDSSRSVQS
jgi:hypothetical protein